MCGNRFTALHLEAQSGLLTGNISQSTQTTSSEPKMGLFWSFKASRNYCTPQPFIKI